MGQLAIGIDIGASTTKIGLVGSGGRLLEEDSFPSNLAGQNPAQFLETAYTVVEELAAGRQVRGIGIALCSLINADHSGAMLSVNAPALNDFDIRGAFAARYHCPVIVLNDVIAYALAEYHFGEGRGVQRLLCLGLGTGLAIAVIHDGAAIGTWGGVTADAGRVILDPGAEVLCNGGVRGSAEALCGVQHIERLARQKYAGESVTAREVIEASREGSDPRACEVMAEIGRSAGHLLAILSPIYFPQRILVTGGSAEAGKPLFRAIRETWSTLIGSYITRLLSSEHEKAMPVEIMKGSLGPEAAVIGAALGFLEG